MIGIIGAMEDEVETLKADMEIEEVITKASMTFCKGRLEGQEELEKLMRGSVRRFWSIASMWID